MFTDNTKILISSLNPMELPLIKNYLSKMLLMSVRLIGFGEENKIKIQIILLRMLF